VTQKHQTSLFDDPPDRPSPRSSEEPKLSSEAEVFAMAREKLDPPGAEPPLLRAMRERQEQINSSGAGKKGVVARWSKEFGFVSIFDPVHAEWHDLSTREAPKWALWEAATRKRLWKAGNRHAYDLSASEIREIWEAEHPLPEDSGIVEEHPIEDEEGDDDL
jgi:hypothetical protein